MKRNGFKKTTCAALAVLLVVLSGGCGSVYAKSFIPPDVDVWTDNGGFGPNAPGGTYQVGELITLFFSLSHGGDVLITVSAPYGSLPISPVTLSSGGTYQRVLGVAENIDVGQWQVVVEAGVLGVATNTDTTWFTIVRAPSMPPTLPQPPPLTPPSPSTPPPAPPAEPLVPVPSSPSTSTPTLTVPSESDEPITSVDIFNASALIALMALKMAEGAIPEDLVLDATEDGRISEEDAQLILQWAVIGASFNQ